MEAVGRKTGWHGPGFRSVMENGAEWVSVTMKTRWGPTRVLREFEEELRRDGWKVDFKANWWSPANYGVAMFEAERDGKRKVVVLKWAVTGEERIVKVEGKGTAARVWVLIQTGDGTRSWGTVGASTNIIEASLKAITDSMEYWLMKECDGNEKRCHKAGS